MATVFEYTENWDKFSSWYLTRTRRLVSANQETVTCSKLHKLYTSCKIPASFGSRKSLKLKLQSNCTYNEIDNFLRKSETYTKFKQAHRNFKRLEVRRYRLNDMWSFDLTDMQPLSKYNQDITILFVAVDTLSRFLWALALQREKSAACHQTNIAGVRSGHKDCSPKHCRGPNAVTCSRRRFGLTRNANLYASFPAFVNNRVLISIHSICSETKWALLAERNIRSLKSTEAFSNFSINL